MTSTLYLNKLLSRLEVPHDHHQRPTMLLGPDIEPVEIARQLWGFFSYFGYWGIPNLTIWTWSTGGALVDLGLNIRHAMGAITVSNLLICAYICLNSVPGWKYHIGFCVSQRITFGIYGYVIPVLVRIVLSVIFYGAQSWLGGVSVVVMLSGLSKLFLNLKNTFPSHVSMETRDFIGFVIFQLVQMLFLTIPPHKLDTLLVCSCGATFVAFITMLCICISDNHGIGPLLAQKVALSTSRTEWMWLYAISIWNGALSPDIMNQNDFSRYARSATQMNWGIIVAILTTGTVVPLAGLLCASATDGEYGSPKWMPTEIIIGWLHESYSARNRVVAVIFGLIFSSSQLAFNIVANGLAGGMAMTGICPKFINIRRGAFITALLSWVAQPWTYFNSSSIFMDVMCSLGIATNPIIAISVGDFLVVRNSNVPVLDLYNASSDGTFYFWRGINWRAMLVWVVTVAVGIPGMISNFGEKNIPRGFINFFYGNGVFSFLCPFIAYVVVCAVFPVNGGELDEEDDLDNFPDYLRTDLAVSQINEELMPPKDIQTEHVHDTLSILVKRHPS